MNTITLIAYVIGFLGMISLLILIARIIDLNKRYKKDNQQRKEEGFSDLLNYAVMIEDGIILCKNGSLIASWLFEGTDHESETEQVLNFVSQKLNLAFSSLGSNWVINVDSIRVEAPKYIEKGFSYFPDFISYAIDAERRAFFEKRENMYEGANVISLTYIPASAKEQKIVEMMYDDDFKSEQTNNEVVETFKKQLEYIENVLSTVLKLHRLRGVRKVFEDGSIAIFDEQLQFLQYSITGQTQPIQLPETPMYLDLLLGGQDLYTGTIPKLGENYIQTVSIDGFPSTSYPTILARLSNLGVNCRFSTRFMCLDQHEAESITNKRQKKWKQKEKGIKDVITNNPNPQLDQDAVMMAQDAGEGLTEIRSGLVSYGYYTATLILMDKDRKVLAEAAKEVQKIFMNIGFIARIETINNLEAYLGSLPSHTIQNVRKYFISTYNLAHLIPSSSIYTGENKAPCPFYPAQSPPLMHCVTNGTTPYRLNLHVRDVGHTLILGPTGAGKSTLLALIAAQAMRYKDATIFAFDKGMSLYPLCQAVGGTFYNIAAEDSKLSFAPFKYLVDNSSVAWTLDWVEKILELNKVVVTPQETLAVQNALNALLESRSENHTHNLSNFRAEVQSEVVKNVFQQYDAGSAMGNLLSGRHDSMELGKFTLFEMETLMSMGEKWILPVIDYIFRRIQLSLKGQPAFIFLDEAWVMFQHPAFQSKIIEWLKVFRKANACVILSTQSFTDAFNPALVSAITEYTSSKIFLPNVYANNPELKENYMKLGLNEQQINIISSAIPKKHYYHTTAKGSRLCELAIGNLGLSFLGVSDAENIAMIKELSSNNKEWYKEWLKMRNVNYKQYIEGYAHGNF